MPELVAPSVRQHRSFVAAAEEILAGEDDNHYAGLTVVPAIGGHPGEAFSLDEVRDADRFATFVSRLGAIADADAPLPPGVVPATVLWWVDGDEFLGRLSIRHALTPWLRDFGGHIGYVVRPSARRRGHATRMLAASLPRAASLGINPALVTCDDTNVASRRVIEANGGVLEDQRGEKLRFWVPTGPR